MKMYRGGIVGVLVATLSCAPQAVQPISHERCGPSQAAREDDIHEVVLRRVMAMNAWMYPKRATVYLIGVGDKPDSEPANFDWDPTDELLSRFSSQVPPVRPLSAASFRDGGVVEASTGRAGAVISAGGVCWLSPTEVEVEAMRWLGPMSGQGYQYRLMLKSGKWVIATEKVTWVS